MGFCDRALGSAILLAALAISPTLAKDAGNTREARTYALSERGDLILIVPGTWQGKVDAGSPEEGVVVLDLQYESEEPLDWSFVVRALWDVDERAAISDEELRDGLNKTSEQYRGRVVEPQIAIREERGDGAVLYYFSVTDTEQKPDEYLYLTQGVARIGRVVAEFAVLSNGSRAEIERLALEVLRTATHEWEDGP